MSDIRFNQWLHNSGTGGVSQVDGGHVGIGTTNPLIPVGAGNTSILNVGVVTANSYYGNGVFGDVNIGASASNTTIHSSGLFNGATPKLEVKLGGASNSYTRLINITNPSGQTGSESLGRVGIKLSLGSEASSGESNKSGAIYAESTSTYNNATALCFGTNNVERIRINSSGNVRIGGSSDTTDQGYRFTLQGSANATYLQFFDNGTGTTHGSDGSFVGLINQDFYVWNREAKAVIFGSSNNERLRITSNGNIGAGGITSPLWTSGGGIHLNDNYGIGFGNGGSGRPDFQLMVTDGSKLEFRCGFGADTADIVMDTSGRLLVGTTSQSISSNELFEVKSTAGGFSHFRNNSSSYAPIYIDNEATNNGSTLAPLITITDGGGNRAGLLLNNSSVFNISGQGAVTFSTGATVGNATERLRITSGGIIQCGTSAVLKAEINNAVSGHQFISQCSDNNNGFEVYQQHGSTTTRNTFAAYANTGSGGAKELHFSVRGDGVVTKPNNPSFHAGAPNGSGNGAGEVWYNTSAIYSNVGSHYNNSNGRFTAPVAGQYFFFHWGMSNSANQTCDVYSRKNGSRDQIGTSYNHASGAQHDQFGCSYVRTLSAGDYVDVYTSSGNIYATSDGRHGGWGGWLIG